MIPFLASILSLLAIPLFHDSLILKSQAHKFRRNRGFGDKQRLFLPTRFGEEAIIKIFPERSAYAPP
jgi:hypothetical protein